MKKVLALILSLTMLLCGAAFADEATADESIYAADLAMVEGLDVSTVKMGFIFVGDESEGYTAAHYEGVKTMCEVLGMDMDTQVEIMWNIPENEECYEAAIKLVEDGCTFIFANSFGHEDYMKQAAAECPDVMFCHATGYQAASSGLANLRNYFVDVYQSRYVSGVIAGCKLNEMIADGTVDATATIPIGYVGAKAYAEVVSGYTAFYLGLKSMTDADVQMYVSYTGSWADQALEYDAATSLINDYGCVLISQHADTTGAASACEQLGTYQVGYNVGMIESAPNYHLTSASLNWGAYYTYAAACAISGNDIKQDWCYGYNDGAVMITEINAAAFASEENYTAAVAAADAAIAGIKDGTIQVFDTATWTVDGETITTTTDNNHVIDGVDFYGAEYIKTDDNGVSYFAESTLASAPSFAFRIDGITEVNQAF